jgi:hypothetical protein
MSSYDLIIRCILVLCIQHVFVWVLQFKGYNEKKFMDLYDNEKYSGYAEAHNEGALLFCVIWVIIECLINWELLFVFIGII